MTPRAWFVFLLHSDSRAVAVSVDASPCSKSGFLLVTLSIQNAITSWNNFGRWQGWFECRKGPTVCADRNPKMWLANGSTANLTFVYEPDFLNLGTGKGDYRMRFLGTTTAVNAALQQLQIRGSSLGSNILKIEVEDRPAAFAYDVRFDEFWNPKSLFRTEIGMSVEQAQLACKYVAAHTHPPPALIRASRSASQPERAGVGQALLRLPVPAHTSLQPGGGAGQHGAVGGQPLDQPAGCAPKRVLLLSHGGCHENEFLRVRRAADAPAHTPCNCWAGPTPSVMFVSLLTPCVWATGCRRCVLSPPPCRCPQQSPRCEPSTFDFCRGP